MHLLLSGTYPTVRQDWMTEDDDATKGTEEQARLKEDGEEDRKRQASLGLFKSWNEFNELSQATRLRTHDTLAKRRTEERKPSLQDIFVAEDDPMIKEELTTSGGAIGPRPTDKNNNDGVVNFERKEWDCVSTEARSCLLSMLQLDPSKRASAEQVLRDPWLSEEKNGEKKRN